jgi:hypothetical protein
MTVPVLLVTVSRVIQLPGSVAEYCTVIILPAVPVIEKVKELPFKAGAPRLGGLPLPPPPPIVVKVKVVEVPRTPPAVYWGLALVVPVTLRKTMLHSS